MIKKFPKNTEGRDWVVGDIHGCFLKLSDHLTEIGFNPKQGDRLFSVGDLVDRGPNSEWVLAWLNQPWFFAVRGNHEVMACDFYNGTISEHGYQRNGGEWLIQLSEQDQYTFVERFSQLPVAIEIETQHGPVGIVHAECPYSSWQKFSDELQAPDFDFSKMEYQTTWSRELIKKFQHPNTDPEQIHSQAHVTGLYRLIVGHTPIDEPLKLANIWYIDTGAVNDKPFTVLNLADLP